MPIRTDYAPGEFCWIDLNAHDLKAAAAWYAGLFGWTHSIMDTPGGGPPYAFFHHAGGVVGGVGQMSDEMKAHGVPPMWNSYVSTEDCHAVEAKVRELGGTVTVPTMDVPNHGRLAFFMDPEGASFAAWQATAAEPVPTVIHQAGALCWNELMCKDTAKAKAFYADLFGWEYKAMPMQDFDYTMIRNADSDAGGLMPMNGPQFEGVPPHWLVYFAVDDVAASSAKAESTGGRVVVPPTKVDAGIFSVIGDPQGGVFGLFDLSGKDC